MSENLEALADLVRYQGGALRDAEIALNAVRLKEEAHQRSVKSLKDSINAQGKIIASLSSRLMTIEALVRTILESYELDSEPTIEEQFQANRRERMSRQQERERVEYMSRMG